MFLGYTESEVWRMTPRKILALNNEYRRLMGLKTAPDAQSIDDILPEGI
jgi:hypothetical protein